jgi:hypothetical protein
VITSRQLNHTPAYITLVAANMLPVYGAMIGKLVFFQVMYLYWFESLLLILFDLVRIVFARGREYPDTAQMKVNNILVPVDTDYDLSMDGKVKMVLSTALIRTALLLFYLIFILAFIGFQVTDKAHRSDVFDSVMLRGPFVSAAIWAFVISSVVQLIAGFFLNGEYRRMSPRQYTNFFSGRIILMHVMIVGSVFIHNFLFDGKTYAAKGEIVYIGVFMLFKTIGDVATLGKKLKEEEGVGVPMI